MRALSSAVGLVFIVGIILYMGLVGGKLPWYISPATLAICIILPFGLGLLSYGFDGMCVLFRSFRLLFVKPREEDLESPNELILEGMMAYTRAAGVIAVITGLVTMLQNMADPSKIGPGMAVAILAFLYARILADCAYRPILNTIRYAKEAAAQPPKPTKAFEVIALDATESEPR